MQNIGQLKSALDQMWNREVSDITGYFGRGSCASYNFQGHKDYPQINLDSLYSVEFTV